MTRLVAALLLCALPALAQPVALDLPADALDGGFAARRVAVVIGVEAYTDPLFPALAFARADAEAMGDALGDPAIGGYDRVVRVTAQRDTTRGGILAALTDALDAVGPDDTLLVYISGHGTLDLDWQRQPDLFLAATDTRKADLPGTALRVRDVQDLVGGSRAARRVLVIDACHHGAGKSSVPSETLEQLKGLRGTPTPLLRQPERGFEAHLFASTFGLPALEDAALGHGVYTAYLLRAMRQDREEADLDGDGLVSVAEAHDYARDRTIAHTGAVQVPRAEYRITGREQIFLSGTAAARTEAERAVLFAMDERYAFCSVLIDGRPRGLLVRGVPLTPGVHDVEVRSPSGELIGQRTVIARAGRVVPVEQVLGGAPRMRVGASVGPLMGLGKGSASPWGGPLLGVSASAGGSLPARRAVRLHLRGDLSWAAGRHVVAAEQADGLRSFEADVHALGLSGLAGVDLRRGPLGLVLGPRVGVLGAVRTPRDGAVARAHLVMPAVDLAVLGAVTLTRGLALTLEVAPGITASAPGSEAPVSGTLRAGIGLAAEVR